MRIGIYKITVPCPWCGRGETLADKPAPVYLSCRCHECGRFYSIDLINRRALRAPSNPKAQAKHAELTLRR